MKHPMESLGERIESVTEATGRQERIEITKIALKEAIREWLDERLREVGRWSLRGIFAAAFAALVYFILTHTGWSR